MIGALHRDLAFRSISRGARLLFYVLREVAAEADQAGALALRSRPMTIAELADAADLSTRSTSAAIKELLEIQFVRERLDGAYMVETVGVLPIDPAAAARQRRRRGRDRTVTDTVTEPVTVTGMSREQSRAASPPPSPPFPEPQPPAPTPEHTLRTGARPHACSCETAFRWVESLPQRTSSERVVDDILTVFANAKLASARDKIRPTWLGWLREMRDEGFALPQITAALVVAHQDANHAPLRASSGIWSALRRASRELVGASAAGSNGSTKWVDVDRGLR